jgi:hypothetical protein
MRQPGNISSRNGTMSVIDGSRQTQFRNGVLDLRRTESMAPILSDFLGFLVADLKDFNFSDNESARACEERLSV